MVKEHNSTGLRYFCKTTKIGSAKEKYLGSGIRWKRHLHKYGNNISTLWEKTFNDTNELIEFATAFSEIFDIVNSPGWANSIIENGLDGCPAGIKKPGKGGRPKGYIMPAAEKAKHKGQAAWNKGLPYPRMTCLNCRKEFCHVGGAHWKKCYVE